jgi:Zn-finger in ubiquitin-hydrolases and other protein
VTSIFTDPDLTAIQPVTPHTPNGCEECLELGTPWVHLRLCLTCGHVGCCDSSPMRHANMTMLLIAAPILIDAKTSRTFLEQAQQLGGQLVNILAADAKSSDKAAQSAAQVDRALQELNGAAAPLLALLEVQPQAHNWARRTGAAHTYS